MATPVFWIGEKGAGRDTAQLYYTISNSHDGTSIRVDPRRACFTDQQGGQYMSSTAVSTPQVTQACAGEDGAPLSPLAPLHTAPVTSLEFPSSPTCTSTPPLPSSFSLF